MAKSPAQPQQTLRNLQADQHLLEAQRLRADGKIDQAAALVYRIVQAMPDHTRALRLMASLAMQTGAPDIAIGALQRALVVSPRTHELLLELGDALVAGKRPAEAISAYKQAIALRPGDGAAFRGLGQAQVDMGNTADALKSFRKTLAILPYDQYAAHMIAALSGETGKSSAGYVPDLFDSYAEIFDEHLTGTLGYHVPDMILDHLLAVKPSGDFGTVLDLGCGTGLVAAALASHLGAIDGIDISPKMVRKAQDRNIYRHLKTGDALDLLANDPDFAGPYDLVTAADVLIYFGPLEPSFAAIVPRLSAKGLFTFSVETTAADQITLQSSGRFAHPAAYIERLAEAHGCTIVVQQDITVRLERNQPIAGQLYLLQRK